MGCKITRIQRKGKKSKIYENIGKEFGCSADEIRRKIHNMRNQVSQELKKINKTSGSGTEEYRPTWPYFNLLKFVIPGMTASPQSSLKMDQENKIDDKLERQRELTNARVKKYREKKRAESQQLNELSEEMLSGQAKEDNTQHKRFLSKERSRRYRDKKRLNVLISHHHEGDDSRIPKSSHENPPSFALRNQQAHDSQIAGTLKNKSIPLVRYDLEILNYNGENLLSPLYEENHPKYIDDNLVPKENEECAPSTLNEQCIKSSAAYSTNARPSSVHACQPTKVFNISREKGETEIKNKYTNEPVKKKKKRSRDDLETINAAVKMLQESDEYESFGDYVASELRSLRSDVIRRRLKSEIRKAIVRATDEDDMVLSFGSLESTRSQSPLHIPTSSAPDNIEQDSALAIV